MLLFYRYYLYLSLLCSCSTFRKLFTAFNIRRTFSAENSQKFGPFHRLGMSHLSNPPINSDDMTKVRDVAAPLLDTELVQKTISDWSKPLPSHYFSSPLVIVGPSGVGKGRLIRSLIKDYAKFFRKVVSHTTRSPRRNEINGSDYYFVSKNFMEDLIADNFFLESAKVHSNKYGISFVEWNIVRKINKIPILEIDIQGARKIKSLAMSLNISPHYLFISPSNMTMLRERLLQR